MKGYDLSILYVAFGVYGDFIFLLAELTLSRGPRRPVCRSDNNDFPAISRQIEALHDWIYKFCTIHYN